MNREIFSHERLKLLVWSISAGTIVSFFYVTAFLSWANIFDAGDSVLFIGPLMCGLILGIVSYEQEAVNTVIGTIIMTVVATLAVALTLFYPFLLGVVSDPSGLLYFIYIPQNMMITVILVLPLSLLGSISGRLFAENTFQSSVIKKERESLRSETEEWYKMLEEKLEEKKAALEKLERERDQELLNVEETPPPMP
ncbi:MAG: hypothetical protein R6W91_04270 [Thermoplasmata archaeon]